MRFAFLGTVLMCVGTIAAATPITISHQGYLLDGGDVPVHGTHDLTVRLWNHPTATALTAIVWTDTFVGGDIAKGYYSAVLGDTSVAGHENSALESSLFAGPVYLSLIIDNGPELLPRHRITTVPTAALAQDSLLLGGTAASLYLKQADTTLPLNPSGVASTSTFLRGDGSWQTLPAGGQNTTYLRLDGTNEMAAPLLLSSDPLTSGRHAVSKDQLDGALAGYVPATATIALDHGGTGSTTAAGARTALGLGSLALLSAVGDAQITDVSWSKITNGSSNPAYLQNGTAVQAASFNIGGAGTVGGLLKAGSLEVSGAVNLKNNPIAGFRAESLGADPGLCDLDRRGQIYFNTTLSAFVGCNGTAWRALDNALRGRQSNPGTSCKDIRDSGDAAGSGLYWVRPSNPFQVYCDMVTAGGGWTIVWAGNTGDPGDRPYTENDYGSDPLSAKYKIALSKIQAIPQTEHILIRKPLSLNRWVKVSATFLSPTTAPIWPGHNHTPVTLTSSTGESVSVNLGMSNIGNAGGGWYGAAAAIDHHSGSTASASYIDLNNSCAGNYVYTYGENMFAVNTALGGGWPATAGCSSTTSDSPAGMVGIR